MFIFEPRRSFVLTFACLLSLFPASGLVAATPPPFLAGDFAPGVGPGHLAVSEPVALGDAIYFSGANEDLGAEPWVSYGTPETTRLLADLCAGPCGSQPRGFARLGPAVVFHASVGSGSARIYRYEDAELSQVAAFDEEEIVSWAPLGAEVFFSSSSGKIYRSDGSREGTRLVALLGTELPPPQLAVVEERAYFTHSGRLYRLQGGDAEPQPLFVFGTGEAERTYAEGYTALGGGRFVFMACIPRNGILGCDAWASDGTAGGTHRIAESLAEAKFVVWRGRAYFTIRPPAPPHSRIVSTDGTPEGTRIEVTPDFETFVVGATPSRLFFSRDNALIARNVAGQEKRVFEWWNFELVGVLGERIFFEYSDPGGINPPRSGFTRLAVSDGTPGGTFDLLEGNSGRGVIFGDALFFSFAEATAAGGWTGLWRSEGNAAGTFRIAPVAGRPDSSAPRAFRAGDGLAVEVRESSGGRTFLHRLDPVSLADSRVSDLPLEVRAAGGGRVYVQEDDGGAGEPVRAFSYDGESLNELALTERIWEGGAFASDSHYFFFTGGGVAGFQLRESDGTAAGTRVLADFPAGGFCLPECAYPSEVALSGERVFFSFVTFPFPYSAPQIHVGAWDRGAGRVLFVEDFAGGAALLPFSGGRVLVHQFAATESRQTFWLSNAAASGLERWLELEDALAFVAKAVAGNRFYLALPASYDPAVSQGLWTGDLSGPGVRQVEPPSGRHFRQLLPAGDHLFFVYQSAAEGNELGFTDGSAAGTRYFDLRRGSEGSAPQSFQVLPDQRLVFAAVGSDGAGLEPWISDGTEAGTYRLADLNPGPTSSSPGDFVAVGNRLFFQASDGVHGRELWGLDLPPAQPTCPENRLCLAGDRFLVKATAHAPDGDFVGRRVLQGGASGVFSFFSASNWELVVKVLDGCAINEAFWVSAAAASDVPFTIEVEDRASGVRKTWESAGGPAAPILDIGAFPGCALAPPEPVHTPALPPAPPAARCPDGDAGSAALCLGPGGRYRTRLEWRTADGSGAAQPLADGSADSGIFTFFAPDNWETMVKVLDGCALNGRIWVFAAGATDVGWRLTVEDRTTGARKVYENPLGHAAPALTDLGAFVCE